MFEFTEESTDRDRLRAFVQAVDKFISSIILDGYRSTLNQPNQTGLHLNSDAVDQARAALREFHEQRHVMQLLIAIDESSDDQLQSHGLTGDQLQFKLANIRIRERRYLRFPRFRPLRRVIAAIDTLLDSITVANSSPEGFVLSKTAEAVSSTAVTELPSTVTPPFWATSIRPASFNRRRPSLRVARSMPFNLHDVSIVSADTVGEATPTTLRRSRL